jgi:nucleotide-binding universal stress UspA family protein
MAYATLMVYVDANGASEQRVRLAAGLADKFSARLFGCSALAVRPPIGAEAVVIAPVMEAETEQILAKLASKETWFRKIAAIDHGRLEWRTASDYPVEALVREARSADLIVIGRSKESEDVYSSLDLGGVVLKAGRPVLVVPEGISSLRAEHVVIGWGDTREARRAVQDALPFLHEARRVTIAEICGSGKEETAGRHIDDVGGYLGRHRIKSGPKVILHQKGSAAAQLIHLAQEEGADLLVTGAYGHSRLGEWFFGGVTRELLASSPVCCFMSH